MRRQCSWLDLATVRRHATGQLLSTLAEHGGSCLATVAVELYRARGGGEGAMMVVEVVVVVQEEGGTKRPEPAAVHNHSATDSSNDTLPPLPSNTPPL